MDTTDGYRRNRFLDLHCFVLCQSSHSPRITSMYRIASNKNRCCGWDGKDRDGTRMSAVPVVVVV